MKKINVLISGAAGYIGSELVKILLKHKYVNIKYLCGYGSAGKKLSYYDNYFKNKKLPIIQTFSSKLLKHIDFVFTALPNGDAQKLSKKLLEKNILIDLSDDFRLKKDNEYYKWYKKKHLAVKNIKKSIYALPEIKGDLIKKFKIIACPGCYPTSILLPLIPLIKEKLIFSRNIIIDSKSGYSGAGRSVHKKFKNKNLYESFSVYGVANHRHNSEIQQELDHINKSINEFTFTPHLTPMIRGILTNIYVDLPKKSSIKKVVKCLQQTYKNHRFIKILKMNSLVSTNSVINTNNCQISVCLLKDKKKLLILTALDNLIKGGAGQAVQNFNIINNFKITEGLDEIF